MQARAHWMNSQETFMLPTSIPSSASTPSTLLPNEDPILNIFGEWESHSVKAMVLERMTGTSSQDDIIRQFAEMDIDSGSEAETPPVLRPHIRNKVMAWLDDQAEYDYGIVPLN